jgi:hypothetical protein
MKKGFKLANIGSFAAVALTLPGAAGLQFIHAGRHGLEQFRQLKIISAGLQELARLDARGEAGDCRPELSIAFHGGDQFLGAGQ